MKMPIGPNQSWYPPVAALAMVKASSNSPCASKMPLTLFNASATNAGKVGKASSMYHGMTTQSHPTSTISLRTLSLPSISRLKLPLLSLRLGSGVLQPCATALQNWLVWLEETVKYLSPPWTGAISPELAPTKSWLNLTCFIFLGSSGCISKHTLPINWSKLAPHCTIFAPFWCMWKGCTPLPPLFWGWTSKLFTGNFDLKAALLLKSTSKTPFHFPSMPLELSSKAFCKASLALAGKDIMALCSQLCA